MLFFRNGAAKNGPDRPPERWDFSLICLFLGLAAYACSKTEADPDLWGHIKFGQDLWRTGQVLRSDFYSYLTAGQTWINHEWLSEAIFAFVFSLGPAVLIAFKAALAFSVLWLGYRFLRRRGLSVMRAGLLVSLSLLPFAAHLHVIRPLIFSWLLFLLTLFIIHAAENGERRWLWWAPLLFALWANLHGGFLAGIGMLFLWSLLRPKMAWLLLACVAATLANPYGIGLWRFLLRTALWPRWEIGEWQPLMLQTFPGAGYLALLALAVAGFIYSRRERSRAGTLLWIGTALLPLLAVRHSLFFVLGLWVFAGEHIGDVWERYLPQGGPAGLVAKLRAWLCGLHFAGAAVLLVLASQNFRCIAIVPPPHYPAGAVSLLKEAGVNADMAVHFDWGEYVLYHLGPGIRVSMDGRRETLYSESVYREQLNFIAGVNRWDAALDRGKPELALVSREFPVFNLMNAKPGWVRAYEDAYSGLFVRRESPWLQPLLALARQRSQKPSYPCAGW
ncbi:MAG: hypothetical protein KKH28_10205 [Elusimicrobia bacterium]|nr:hypothetical protein [Elusimicrobiota bacterium]